MGLAPDDVAAMKEMDGDAVTERFAEIRDENMAQLEAAGVDTESLVLQVGTHCEWIDVVQMVFRVVDFDRNETTIDLDAGAESVKAKSMTEPYGYLLVESPTLNQPARLPIIHRDDFYLASTIFADPMFNLPESSELLVTYAPKKMNKTGLSTSPHHVLHYALVPKGTLERYYSDDEIGARRMSSPEPHLIFGSFEYDGMISVVTNNDPQL